MVSEITLSNILYSVKVCAQLLSRVLLFVTPGAPPGSSVHGIFLARILEWVAISSSKGSS